MVAVVSEKRVFPGCAFESMTSLGITKLGLVLQIKQVSILSEYPLVIISDCQHLYFYLCTQISHVS